MNQKPVDKKPRCIVAIAGSAGALEAFEDFFKALPTNLEAGFVVLQHMSPDHESFLIELLARHTLLPVIQAKNGETLLTGHIYVQEPGTLLEMKGAVFTSHPINDVEERHHPIDYFFNSLAHEHGANAVGILVSGTGSDGTKGLRQIKQSGGQTLVQVPSEAKFDDMPKSAINAAVVDKILTVAEIAHALSGFVECSTNAEVSEIDQSTELATVCDILRRKTGHDFSSYKKSTVARRVERRIHANELETVSAYIEFLEKSTEEARALLSDLLIGVTQFFRDPEAFSVLKSLVVPRLFDETPQLGTIRVWVPACATGEEVYTIGMLLKEFQQKHRPDVVLQIFATDIDRTALEFGRQGIYPETISTHLPAELLGRYFKNNERGFQVRPELREICIFSEHSLLKNPPFSKIDLISCRNLFIYLEPDLQSKILPLFHFSLRSSGFLFLGPAENIPTTNEFFKSLDIKNRIFQRLGVASRGHLVFPISHNTFRALLPKEPSSSAVIAGERDPGRVISSVLLEQFAPPAFVISEHGDIAFFSGKTAKYLELPTGIPNTNIFDIICRPLKPEIQALIYQCVKTKQKVMRHSVPLEISGKTQSLNLTVRPLVELNTDLELYLVVLEEVIPAELSQDEASRRKTSAPHEVSIIDQLQEQLRDTREHLQNTIEVVKCSNEELLSMNEELQSTIEELSTSKEELQSTNEELQAVNSELSRKLEELDGSNSDLQNFLQGVQIPILFLNREFRVQKYTPAVARIFRLIPSDLGREISDISSSLVTTDFAADFHHVLQTLEPIQRELQTIDETGWYIMRISPYRTINNVISGLVLAFSDVTELKRAQVTKNTMAAIVESSSDAIISKNLKSVVTSWNKAATLMFGYSDDEIVGKSIKTLIPTDRIHEEDMILAAVLRGEGIHHYETERLKKDGTKIQVSISVSAVKNAAGVIVGAAKIARDIFTLKKTEEALRNAVRSRDEFLSVASHELKTPLTTLKMQAQLRQRAISMGDTSMFTMEKLKTMINTDERQINRLNRLIDDMLDITRIRSGKLAINPETVDLCALVKDVTERLASQLASAHCELALECIEKVQGEWDLFRIEQVVNNLITNAIKYGPGKPIHIKVFENLGNAIFSIRDHGEGIAKSDQDRIFNQFERAASTNVVSGLGLGLYIAKQIIDIHGGTIRVESVVGKGSQFVVELPLGIKKENIK